LIQLPKGQTKEKQKKHYQTGESAQSKNYGNLSARANMRKQGFSCPKLELFRPEEHPV
jgi:hypothetical protein